MKKYEIRVEGCDYETEFAIELSGFEFETVKKIAKICNETSECRCQPRIYIEDVDLSG